MLDRETITEYVQDTYNGSISVYAYSDYLRVTNGSAAHKADIKLSDNSLVVRAERYGETHSGEYDRTIDGLKEAMRKGLGL